MPLTRTTTAYNLIADALRRQVLSGALAPGQQLATEQRLCEQFGASRITIRRALQILEEELLIQRRQGSGTFVSPAPSRKIPLLITDFAGSVARHAPEMRRRIDEWGWRSASPAVAAALRTLPGDRVLFARRIDVLGRIPVAYDEVHLPEAAADRLVREDLSRVRFIERWQEVQRLGLSHLTQALEAAPAGPIAIRLLRVKAQAPLLKETDVFFATTGRAVGLFTSYYRHDTFRMTATIRLPPAALDEPEANGDAEGGAGGTQEAQ